MSDKIKKPEMIEYRGDNDLYSRDCVIVHNECLEACQEWHDSVKLTEDEMKQRILEYSNPIPDALGDRFITIGGVDDLARAIIEAMERKENGIF